MLKKRHPIIYISHQFFLHKKLISQLIGEAKLLLNVNITSQVYSVLVFEFFELIKINRLKIS
jgi:hypothetical protein